MMRLGRRASLLVAFYLLTSAATAYAECAWVLWLSTTVGTVSETLPSEVFPTWDRCNTAQQELERKILDAWVKEAAKAGQEWINKVEPRRQTAKCFPDTIDPRTWREKPWR
jgi:hypothetical protein